MCMCVPSCELAVIKHILGFHVLDRFRKGNHTSWMSIVFLHINLENKFGLFASSLFPNHECDLFEFTLVGNRWYTHHPLWKIRVKFQEMSNCMDIGSLAPSLFPSLTLSIFLPALRMTMVFLFKYQFTSRFHTLSPSSVISNLLVIGLSVNCYKQNSKLVNINKPCL